MFTYNPITRRVTYEVVTRIAPFTQRAGDTYLTILAELQAFVNELAGHVNDTQAELLADVTNILNETIDIVNVAIQGSEEYTDTAIATINSTVNTKLVELEQRVDAAIQNVVDSAIEISDTVVSGVVADAGSDTRAALDAIYAKISDVTVTSVAGRTGDVVLTPDDVGAGETSASGTIPVRRAGGEIRGVGTPTVNEAAANKKYVDNVSTALGDFETSVAGQFSDVGDDVSLAMSAAMVTVTHKAKIVSGVHVDVFTISTGGKYYPGVVSRKAATNYLPTDLSGFLTPLEGSTKYGVPLMANASGYDTVNARIRGANIADGVAYGELSNVHPQDNAAIGLCADGKLRYYEYAKGDSAATMLADGVIDSWSWGPALVLNGATNDYMSSGGWGTLNRTAKSARTVLCQRLNGDIVIMLAYGETGSSGLTVDESLALFTGENIDIAVLLDGGGSTQAAWRGEIVHASSDAESRTLCDFVAVNAHAGNGYSVPPVTLTPNSPYTGSLTARIDASRLIVTGQMTGNNAAVGNSEVTTGALPPWMRNFDAVGFARGGGTTLGASYIRPGYFGIGASTSAGLNNPFIYLECAPVFGFN